MQSKDQTLEEIVANLSPLDVEWMDQVATSVIAKLTSLPRKDTYGRDDIFALFEDDFETGIICARLFLALSKDKMDEELRRTLGSGGTGSNRLKNDRNGFLGALEKMDLAEAMRRAIHYVPVWGSTIADADKASAEKMDAARKAAVSAHLKRRKDALSRLREFGLPANATASCNYSFALPANAVARRAERIHPKCPLPELEGK